ncbi:MAG TPA: hypothetical protein VF631_10780 [Allosphingosinicella sp.]|uniref:hypothetical protein n=1 Tax=Allosphingosinicella sp. TaxID=2823234 RepID=UPI002F28714F
MADRRWGTGKLGDGRPTMPRIWPHWARSIGGMLAGGAAVRFACGGCRRLFDVDLTALAVLRGAEWSLIDRRARCKASKCRARGLFVAAAGRHEPFLLLATKGAMPSWLAGTCPADHEPPPPPGPPVPIGVDKERWYRASSDAERKRLVREARG